MLYLIGNEASPNIRNLGHYSNNLHSGNDVDFGVFRKFSPEKELLTLNNQFTVSFDQFRDEETNINAIVRNIRVTFLIPDLKRVVRFYVDSMLDMKEVPEKVKAQMVPVAEAVETLIEEEEVKEIEVKKVLATDQRPLNNKTFTLSEKYIGGGTGAGGPGARSRKSRNPMLSKIVKNAKYTALQEKAKEELKRKRDMMKGGFVESSRNAKQNIKITVTALEVVMPENLYEFPS